MSQESAKKYVYIVMMNWDPMGSYPDWQPLRAFMSRKEARAYINKVWKEQFPDHTEAEIPIEKGEWLHIDKVRMG